MGRPAGHPTVTEAYSVLVKALGTTDPSCRGDDRFTDDHTDAATLLPICQACLVFEQCRDVAVANPAGKVFGVLAGRVCRSAGRYGDRD